MLASLQRQNKLSPEISKALRICCGVFIAECPHKCGSRIQDISLLCAHWSPWCFAAQSDWPSSPKYSLFSPLVCRVSVTSHVPITVTFPADSPSSLSHPILVTSSQNPPCEGLSSLQGFCCVPSPAAASQTHHGIIVGWWDELHFGAKCGVCIILVRILQCLGAKPGLTSPVLHGSGCSPLGQDNVLALWPLLLSSIGIKVSWWCVYL